jgi:hypothetical protein
MCNMLWDKIIIEKLLKLAINLRIKQTGNNHVKIE